MTSASGTTVHTASRHRARRARSSVLPPHHSVKDRITRISLDFPQAVISRRLALIMVMEPSDFRHGDHLPTLWELDRLRLWTVHRQRQMGTKPMIISKVAGQDTREMPFVYHYHMVQAFPADTPNEALDVWILPWRPGSSDDLSDVHMAE